MTEWQQYIAHQYALLEAGTLQADYQRTVAPHLVKSPQRILDIGVGPGGHLAALSALSPGASMHGIDANRDYLQDASRELKARRVHAQLITGSGDSLPYRDESFDLIMSHLTLPYAYNDRTFLSECARVIAPGGGLWLSTHGPGFFAVRMFQESMFYKVRWSASLLAGFLSMHLGWKPVKDTPVTRGWLQDCLCSLGLDMKLVTSSDYKSWARIITVFAAKPLPSKEAKERTP